MTILSVGFVQVRVNRKSFDRAVELLNCRMTELSLKRDGKYSSMFKRECSCDSSSNDQILQFLRSNKIKNTISLFEEVNTLKNFNISNLSVDDVVDLLSDNIFADKRYGKIRVFVEKRSNNNEFESFKADLRSELKALLLEGSPRQADTGLEVIVSNAKNGSESSVLEMNKTLKYGVASFLGGQSDFLILISLIISISALIVSVRRKKTENGDDIPYNIRKYVKEKIWEASTSRKTEDNSKISSDLNALQRRIDAIERRIDELKRRIDELYSEIEEVQDLVKSNTDQGTMIEPARLTEKISKKVEQPPVEFFLSTPNADGSFNETSSSQTYRDGATIYRFTKIDSNTATFRIDERDASLKLALQYPDKNIDPVCEALNAYNPRATRILTVNDGEAILQNGKWVVDQNKKAKIRYED